MKNTKKKNIETTHNKKISISKIPLKEKIVPIKNVLASMLRGLLILIFLMIISYILAPSFPKSLHNLKIGDVASKNIKASEDYLVEDKISTEKNRNNAMKNSVPVYDYNPKMIEEINKKISSAFLIMKTLYIESHPNIYNKLNEIDEFLSISDEIVKEEERKSYQQLKDKIDKDIFAIESSEYFAKKEIEFKNTIGIELSNKSLKTLKWHHYNPRIEEQIQYLLTTVLKKGVFNSRKTLNLKNNKGILIRDISTAAEHIQKKLFEIRDIQETEAFLTREVRQVVNKAHKALQRTIFLICKEFVQPNLTFNSSETEIRKKKAAESIKLVFTQIKKGEMIVREGERITEEHLIKLGGLSSKRNLKNAVLSTTGLFIFVTLVGFLLWSYIKRFKPFLAAKKGDLMLLAVILICSVIICKLFVSMALALSGYTGYIQAQSYYFAVPYAAGPMLVAMLFGVDIGVIFSIITFIFTGLMLEGNIYYALFALTGSLCVVFRESQYVGRLSILGAGFFISLVNVITILPIHLISSSSFSFQFVLDIIMGALGGIIVAIVVSSLLPLLEYFFGVTSDIKLLELSNLNHNLLREMLVNAPGTYQHSMVVSGLAEEAAKSVNANYLLVRVGSYYHDIGKITKPEYFIENLMGGFNKHDKLSPSMSSLILVAHVKDGVELAKKYDLQPGLVDFILEHHGTDLIRFFYNKAKETEYPKIQSIKEEHFRYLGPKPQSKETAIVMLADSVEAVSRTFTDPTPSRIQKQVEKTINEKFVEGQLDECNLTLKDLHNISKSFIRILNGMFHSRVDYPDKIPSIDVKDKRGAIESTNKESTEESKITPFEHKEENYKNIKKLRLP